MKNAGRAERGAAWVRLAGSPLGLIDISLTKVKYNCLVFINVGWGLGNQIQHLVKRQYNLQLMISSKEWNFTLIFFRA